MIARRLFLRVRASSLTGATSHGARYFTGAALCALVNNIILIWGNARGWNDFTGIVASWFAGGTVGYLWHARITYGTAPGLPAYARFLAGAALGIPLAYAALWLFHQLLGWPMWLAAPTVTVVLFCYHYLNARAAILWRALRQSGTPPFAPPPEAGAGADLPRPPA